MGFLGADLIGMDVHPLVLAHEWTAARARDTLESLGRIAQSIGLGDQWAGATFFGTDVGAGSDARSHGVTLDRAPFAGVGFSRDEDLRRMYPRSIDIVWGSQQALPPEATRLRARLHAILTAHLGEFSAVMNIAFTAREVHSLPVCAQVDVTADWSYDFEEAYRRRIAYALGFAASLAAGSLEPYRKRESALLRGPVDELVNLCRDQAGAAGISVCGVLLVRLGSVLVSADGDTARRLPSLDGDVPDVEPKRRWLEARLRELSDAALARLNEDGRAALNGLLCEIEREQRSARHGRDRYPSWGKIATRGEYGLPEV